MREPALDTLTNAAREFIAERLDTIERNEWGMYAPEDMASARREHDAIEAEIEQLETLLAAAWEIARMQYPSIEQLLRARGFGFEADRVAELVAAVKALPPPPAWPAAPLAAAPAFLCALLQPGEARS